MVFGGIFVGKILDDFGPRVPLALGTFLHVFGLMMTSISSQYYQILLSQAVCSAIGASMVFYPAFTCVSVLRTPFTAAGNFHDYIESWC
jgi:nitrate/nitrite transporter NarK